MGEAGGINFLWESSKIILYLRMKIWLNQRIIRQGILVFLTLMIVIVTGLLLEVKAQLTSPYDGVSIPYDSMPEYSVYREELVSKGWIPTSSTNFSVSEPFPELICGNRVCSANWSHESGSRNIIVLVWLDYDEALAQTVYRISPAVE